MLVGEAKAIARRWVAEAGFRLPQFAGAFYHGSMNCLPDDAPFPTGSDLDIMVALDGPAPPVKLGKFLYGGVLLEVSFLPLDQLSPPEAVLGVSYLAGSLRGASVIADPTGQLTALQAVVSRDYAKRRWVRRRCEDVREKIGRNLAVVGGEAPFPHQVTAWLFGTGLTTHLLLVAALENPTVRRRYLAARAVLVEYGQADFYEPLLALLGCAGMRAERVAHHLAAVAAAFDAAKAVVEPSFPFAADLTDVSRPIAIDGSAELIARGDHREAIFWIVATASRCQQIFGRYAPALVAQFSSGYRDLLADLGIVTPADLARRAAETDASVPRAWLVAETIMAANPQIEDD